MPDLVPFLWDLGHTAAALLQFIALALIVILPLIFIGHVDGENRRKLLHMVAMLSGPVMAAASARWYTVAAAAILFALVIYPILCMFEHMRCYTQLFQQRREGEVKSSLLQLFFMEAGIVTIFWGFLHSRVTVIAAILAWGFGDAAAALVGKRWGKKKILWKIADNKKSYAGSVAMLAVDLVIVTGCLLAEGCSFPVCLLTAIVTAMAAAFTELVTKGGYDTVTVPIAAAAAIWGMLQLLT